MLRLNYGMTPEEYQHRVELSEGLCPVCGLKPEESTSRFAVDHAHATGEVRGLLCSHCNRGLGYFRDNPKALRAAAEYLERHQRFMNAVDGVADAGIAD